MQRPRQQPERLVSTALSFVMLQYYAVRNSRNALPLIEACLAKECPRGHEEYTLPDPLFQFLQNIGRQHHRAAPAAGTARIGILSLTVEDLNTAVHMLLRDVNLHFRQ